jgi:F-type H+-transporting ATPase subunit epsilon
MSLYLEIITPDKKEYSDEIDSVILSTTTGEIGVLSGHLPLLTQLKPGKLTITTKEHTLNLAVDRGFAHIYADKISVLTEDAVNVEDINLSEVQQAQNKTEKALAQARQTEVDQEEVDRLEKMIEFSLVKKLVKTKSP